MENKFEDIKSYLENLGDDELMVIHNNYCEKCNYPDDIISYNEEYFISENYSDVWELAKQLSGNSSYSINNNYVRFDGCTNLESTNDVSDWVDFNCLTNYIINNDEDFCDSEIRDILDEDEEDE